MSSANILSIIQTFPENLQKTVVQWLEWDKNPKTLKQIVKLVEDKNETKLSQLLLQRQCFGTAGIRGLMEAGNNGLNDLVVIQTTQGLAKYLNVVNPDKAKKFGVVIGFDGRHNSYRFSRLAAQVFISIGFPVKLFSRIVPTPFVAYGVRLLSCAAGIMVTASHNPKEYNGYKVYFDNGAQILPPHDENIQKNILENLEPWNSAIWNVDSLSYENVLLSDPLQQVSDNYYEVLKKSVSQLDLISKSDLRAVYTPLHGVGHEYLTKAFQTIGFQHYFPVLSQKDPDPEFSTVVFPNPEEGKGVLDESIKTATQSNATLIIANDPDSDRCAIAELNNNEWRAFNGNEIGALLGWWAWKQHKNGISTKIENKDCYMISSAVSSKILETYATKEGFNWFETLTGFKWMSNLADDLEKSGKHILLAFEEAIGFMVGTNVLDKDGISAAVKVIEMATYLRTKNQTLVGLLNEIYGTYGYHYSINSYYICHDSDKISRIFNRVADLNGLNSYISQIDGVKVVRVRDLNRGYDSSTKDNIPLLPSSDSSFMLTLYFENGSVITFRTSGTEPKIKYYSEIIADPSEKNWKLVEDKHRQIVEASVKLILEPEKNELIAKKD